MGSGDDLQEVQAGLLEHRPVLGVEEAQAVLVDDLDLHAFPFLPAPGADRGEHLLLDRGNEGDAVGGRGFAFLSAARAREGHFLLRQTHHSTLTRLDLRGGPRGRDNGGSWKSRSRREASPPSTSRPRPWPASTPWATRPPPTSSSRPSRGPSAARTWWCSRARARARPRPSGFPSSSGWTRARTRCRRWSSLPPGSWPCRWPGSWPRSAGARGSRSNRSTGAIPWSGSSRGSGRG